LPKGASSAGPSANASVWRDTPALRRARSCLLLGMGDVEKNN